MDWIGEGASSRLAGAKLFRCLLDLRSVSLLETLTFLFPGPCADPGRSSPRSPSIPFGQFQKGSIEIKIATLQARSVEVSRSTGVLLSRVRLARPIAPTTQDETHALLQPRAGRRAVHSCRCRQGRAGWSGVRGEPDQEGGHGGQVEIPGQRGGRESFLHCFRRFLPRRKS